MLQSIAQFIDHLQSKLGRCSTCMRLSLLTALAAGAASGLAGRVLPGTLAASLAGVAAIGLTALWLAHVAAFAGRALRRARQRAVRPGTTAGISRRGTLAIIARAAGIGAIASMPVFLAAPALAFCGQCSKDDDCGVGYVCRNTAAVNSGKVCNECVAS
ncbi:MAG TPA: DUF3624 family protein [Kaistiaceae bacterium]|nr:DUF3624 family protein [Kaistiaceae bacterium]